MKQCYNCKRSISFWKTWLFCKTCGFPIEASNVLNDMTYDDKKRLVNILSKELCFTFTQDGSLK